MGPEDMIEDLAETEEVPAEEMTEAVPAEEAVFEDEAAVEGGESATPEEEAAMEAALEAAGAQIYQNDAVWKAFEAAIEKLGLPAAVGETTKHIVVKVDNDLDLPETVILQFGASVAMLITDAAIESGTVEADESVVKDVLSESVQMLLEEYDVDPAEIDAIAGQLNPDDIRKGLDEIGAGNGQ